MKEHFIGTSGWNYDHWKERFYPKGLPSSKWLAYYSERFGTVEINFSFYRLPDRSSFEKWRDETPHGFIFSVKASRYLTHLRKLKDPADPLSRVIEHSAGLKAKRGPILYQLPPHWHLNHERLKAFLEILPLDIRHVIEFRDPTWLVDETFRLLEEHRVAYCIMSSPDLPRVMRVTAPFAYIRMHNGGYVTEGNYDDEQLRWWVDEIGEMLKSVDVYVYFNNDNKAFAVRNAERLKELLDAGI